MEHTSTFCATKVIYVQCSPAHKEAPERFGRTRSRKFSRSEARRRKHAWINRGSSDCSLVARIFRIPRNHQFHSHCFNRGPSISRAAFHERQRSKRVEHWPASDPVEAAIPICGRSGFSTGQDEARGNSGRIRIYRLKIGSGAPAHSLRSGKAAGLRRRFEAKGLSFAPAVQPTAQFDNFYSEPHFPDY
jgi:hypothetical protein